MALTESKRPTREYQRHGIESQRLTTTIGRELYVWLAEYADRRGISRALVVKHALEVYRRLKDEERPS